MPVGYRPPQRTAHPIHPQSRARTHPHSHVRRAEQALLDFVITMVSTYAIFLLLEKSVRKARRKTTMVAAENARSMGSLGSMNAPGAGGARIASQAAWQTGPSQPQGRLVSMRLPCRRTARRSLCRRVARVRALPVRSSRSEALAVSVPFQLVQGASPRRVGAGGSRLGVDGRGWTLCRRHPGKRPARGHS